MTNKLNSKKSEQKNNTKTNTGLPNGASMAHFGATVTELKRARAHAFVLNRKGSSRPFACLVRAKHAYEVVNHFRSKSGQGFAVFVVACFLLFFSTLFYCFEHPGSSSFGQRVKRFSKSNWLCAFLLCSHRKSVVMIDCLPSATTFIFSLACFKCMFSQVCNRLTKS